MKWQIGTSSSGRTTDSGSVSGSSTLSVPAICPFQSHMWPVRLAVQDAALSRRRSPVRIWYGLPNVQPGLRAPAFLFLGALVASALVSAPAPSPLLERLLRRVPLLERLLRRVPLFWSVAAPSPSFCREKRGDSMHLPRKGFGAQGDSVTGRLQKGGLGASPPSDKGTRCTAAPRAAKPHETASFSPSRARAHCFRPVTAVLFLSLRSARLAPQDPRPRVGLTNRNTTGDLGAPEATAAPSASAAISAPSAPAATAAPRAP